MIRAHRINPASVFVEKAPAVRMFPDTVTFSKGVQAVGNEIRFRHIQIPGDITNVFRFNINDARGAGTALAASATGEIYAGVKKIRSVV